MDALALGKLVTQLESVSKRYSKLRGIFGDFCGKAAGLLTAKDSPVSGLKFLPDLENDKFLVDFCGESFEFCFFMDEGRGGGVLCTSVAEDDEKVLGSFSFSGQAESDVKNEEDDVLRMDTPGDAAHLVLFLLSKNFKM